MNFEATITQARTTGDWAEVVAAIPYLGFLGARWSQQPNRRIVTMRAAEHLVGNPALPALHGGTLGAVLESVAHFECLATSASMTMPRTITLTIDYIRSAKFKDIFADATVVKSGRRISTLQARCWQEDEAAPVASATIHLKVD
jgi:uncharacterized protein (TIGR00369 family)